MTKETIHLQHEEDRVVFGFWLYIMSDCLLFGGLFATYAVLHGATFGGPTLPQIITLPYVLIETLVLLTSSFTAGLSILSVHQGKKKMALGLLGTTLLLGLLFVGMEVNEFSHLISEGASFQRSAALSSLFALVGTHGLHVALGSLWLAVLMAHILWRGLETSVTRKLLCFSLFWHFLDIVWIFIFTFVYLIGVM